MKIEFLGFNIGECSGWEQDCKYFNYHDFKPSKEFLDKFPNFPSDCKDGYSLSIMLFQNIYFQVINSEGDVIFDSKLVIEKAKLMILSEVIF